LLPGLAFVSLLPLGLGPPPEEELPPDGAL